MINNIVSVKLWVYKSKNDVFDEIFEKYVSAAVLLTPGHNSFPDIFKSKKPKKMSD